MIIFILGISITLNIFSIITAIFIYKYSFKGFKNRIEDFALKNFMNDNTLDVLNIFKEKNGSDKL